MRLKLQGTGGDGAPKGRSTWAQSPQAASHGGSGCAGLGRDQARRQRPGGVAEAACRLAPGVSFFPEGDESPQQAKAVFAGCQRLAPLRSEHRRLVEE